LYEGYHKIWYKLHSMQLQTFLLCTRLKHLG